MSDLSLLLQAVPGIPLINLGDDLANTIFNAMSENQLEFLDNDVIVIAQKIVSKAEGRIIDLATVSPGKEALHIARETDKDPRQVELILRESNEVLRCKEGVIIVEHRSGIVMANAGIDHSNVSDAQDKELVTLLPEDVNISATNLRNDLQLLSSKKLGVIINDSIGRAWRVGTVGIALGSSGVLPLKDLRGAVDLFGNVLRVSETADADALASAACILMGEADDGTPVVLVRGHQLAHTDENANVLVRNKDDDLFR